MELFDQFESQPSLDVDGICLRAIPEMVLKGQMSNVYLIGDTHFGHKNVTRFRDQFESEEHHRSHIVEQWHKTVTKNDVVWVLGDAAFTVDGLMSFQALPTAPSQSNSAAASVPSENDGS